MFLSFLVIPFVFRPICPNFCSLTLLQVILPKPLVFGSIHMRVHPVAVCLVLFPLACENVAIYMPKSAFSFSLVVLPFALVTGTVRPGLFAETLTNIATPLSVINGPTFKCEGWTLLQNLGVGTLRRQVFGFFFGEILFGLYIY